MPARRSAAVLATFVFVALPMVGAGAAAGGPGGAAAADVAKAQHEAVVAHWTAARMRAAVPRDFVGDPVRGFHIAPNAKPGPGGSGNTSGASWPNGKGEVYQLTGKVFFDMAGSSWVCSGSVVHDSRSGASIVLTAGHCVYDESVVNSDAGFATNWMFIPQFDSNPTFNCGSTAYGCWSATHLVVNRGFASEGGFTSTATRFDWGFAVVGPGGKNGTTQLDSLGDFPLVAASYTGGTLMDAFGYPAAGKYHGNDLVYCQGNVGFDALNGNATYAMPCGMTGGSSGGPWFSSFNTTTGSTGTLSSLNSYGYSGVRNMYGPKFNSATGATFTAANSTNDPTTIVP